MPGPTSSLLVSYTPGSDRNDFTGEVGVRLGVGTSDIPINWIGARRHSSAQTGTHTVTLYEWFGDTVVAIATIDYTGIAVGDFAWTSISPITLLASGYYALLMAVTASDGQTWCNPGAATFAASIVNVYDCYRVPASALATGTPNDQFIGLDLGAGATSVPAPHSMLAFWMGGAGYIAPGAAGVGFRSMLAFWGGGGGSPSTVAPPTDGIPHNLPFLFTPGRLRSM